jgi:small GTP-binding protein
MINRKVLITGSFGVGKTSLFNRFIHNAFSEQYLTTIGVKVDKKNLDVEGQQISLVLWDVAGELSQQKVPKSYFLGASAVIYVFDLSRPASCKNMDADIEIIQKILPGCLITIIGNKKDLVTEETLSVFDKKYQPDYYTSAKTGENVELLFQDIAAKLVISH